MKRRRSGLVWRSSERFLGALVTPSELIYIVPGFERSRVESLPHLSGEIRGWEEEENSAALIASLLPAGASLAVDDAIPLFAYNPLRQEIAPERLLDGGPLIREQRICKSENEIAIIQYAMNLTLEVHRRAHAMIKPGVAASEVVRFIGEQHRALGARGGSTFCIVSFGAATALPHGADGEQFYQPGDVVLVDTGCRIDGYLSDLTRTYMLMSQARNSRRSGPSSVKRNRLSSMPPGWVCPAPLSMVRRAPSLSGMGSDRITSCRACHTGPDMGWALKSTKLPISCAQTRCL
ncbi:peptidase M24 [Brucella abortus]|nr:peptidase M24 [Brucella abortus]